MGELFHSWLILTDFSQGLLISPGSTGKRCECRMCIWACSSLGVMAVVSCNPLSAPASHLQVGWSRGIHENKS